MASELRNWKSREENVHRTTEGSSSSLQLANIVNNAGC